MHQKRHNNWHHKDGGEGIAEELAKLYNRKNEDEHISM